MGLLADSISRICEACSTQSVSALVLLALGSLIALSVIVNVLKQILFKNPNEPPVVFHWFPIIGSTVTYGIDPYKFFFSCREKVCAAATLFCGFHQSYICPLLSPGVSSNHQSWVVRRYFHIHSSRQKDDCFPWNKGQ